MEDIELIMLRKDAAQAVKEQSKLLTAMELKIANIIAMYITPEHIQQLHDTLEFSNKYKINLMIWHELLLDVMNYKE